MIHVIETSGLTLHISPCPGSRRVAYILYPMEALGGWLAQAATKYRISMVSITGMDWDNDLSPWPAPSEPPKETEQSKPTEQPVATERDDAPAEVPAPKEPPATTEPPIPAETEPPVETQPKTAYDYEFDINAIRADCIAIGQGMGYTLNTSLSPQNATWWNPITASESNQGSGLRSRLEQYIRFHTVENLGAYGLDEITEFNICCESIGGGSYAIYFVFA